MEQLAPGGLMWVPLTSTSSIQSSAEYASLFRRLGGLANMLTHHEVYVIRRKTDAAGVKDQFVYRKIMDARYASLRSVEEQLEDRD